MDAIASAVLNKIYAFTINFLRVKVIESIGEGDASLDELRNQLQDQFEQLHDKINKLLIEPLRTAEQNVRLGMTHLDINERDEAVLYFRHAQQNAIAAVTTATSFEGKMIAIRIQLLCVFHIRGYFTESYDPVGLNKVLNTVFQQLCSLPEVESALEGRTKGRSLFRMVSGGGGRLKEVNIVSAVLDLQKQLQSCTSGDYPIALKDGNILHPLVDLRLSTLGSKSIFRMIPERIYFVNGKVYTTDGDAKIRVFDCETMTLIVTLQGHAGAKKDLSQKGLLMVTNKSIFYACNDSTVLSEWSVSTYKLLSTIDAATFPAVQNQYGGLGISAAAATATHIYLVLTEFDNVHVIDLNKNNKAGASPDASTCGYDSSFMYDSSLFDGDEIMSLQASNDKLCLFTQNIFYEVDLKSHDGTMRSFSSHRGNPVELYQKYTKSAVGWDVQDILRAVSSQTDGYLTAKSDGVITRYSHIVADCNYVYALTKFHSEIEQWDIRTQQLVNKRRLTNNVLGIEDIIVVGRKLYCLMWTDGVVAVFV